MMARKLLVTAVVVSAAVRAAAQSETPRALQRLYDAVTFHHSFDSDSLLPDMAAGDAKPRLRGQPQLARGLFGRALIAGTGTLTFAGQNNWTITTRGAATFWIAPHGWHHDHGGNTTFVLSGRAGFYIERQGPLIGPDGRPRRHELLLTGVQRGPKGSRSAGCRDWKEGEWHFLAVDWSWPQLALSVDGGEFRAVTLPDKPQLHPDLILGATGGDPTLLDELYCFRRPLSRDEAQSLYDHQLVRD